jgi:hypothetical protein
MRLSTSAPSSGNTLLNYWTKSVDDKIVTKQAPQSSTSDDTEEKCDNVEDDQLSAPIESKSHLSTTYRDGPRQPVLLSYKQTLICSKLRSFGSHWYLRYPFVEYSESHDAVYCFVCRHFPPKCGNADKQFVETGCRNWKKLGDKLQKHVESGSHPEAAAQWSAAKESDVTGSVLNKLDTHHKQVVIRNREAVTMLIRAVLFCAR